MRDYNFTGQTLWIQENDKTVHFISGSVETQQQIDLVLEIWESQGFNFIWKRAKKAPALVGPKHRTISKI